MSHDYDRTKTAAADSWGTYVDKFMVNTVSALAGKLGKGQKPQKFGSGGYFLTVTGYTRSDMEFEATISASWSRGTVFVMVNVEHPMRGNQEALKAELGYDDSYEPYVQRLKRYFDTI